MCTAAAGSPSEHPVQEEAARSSKRGKAKEKSAGAERQGDMLENILDGQYESMAFGNYEEAAAMESVAFDGDYAPSVFPKPARKHSHACVGVLLCIVLLWAMR